MMMKSCKAGTLLAAVILVLSAEGASGRQVVISEIMASNVTTLYDEDGDTPDWIELYNAGSEAVSLDGYGLTDNPLNPFEWEFSGQTIEPGEYLIVMASGKDRTAQIGAWETVVTRGTQWRYLFGSAVNSAWTGQGYNDSSWPVGPSGFGYGDGDDATEVDAGTITVYTRTTFEVDDPAQLVGARLHVDYDDSFVAYVNGTEIARANIGAPGEPTSVGQTADRDREATMYAGGGPVGYIITNLESLFLPGDNVLAVEVHNVGSGSSDMSLIPFLTLATASEQYSVAGVDPELEGLFGTIASHTDFSLSEGETVCVTPPDSPESDCVEIIPGPSDISFGPDPTGGIAFMEFPTPGNPNSGFVYAGQAPAAIVSHTAGFYTSPFDLTIASPDPAGRIAYTTDGSEPPTSGTVTSATINVGETQVVRARVSVPGMLPGPIVTQTYLFEPTRTLPVVSISTTPANLWDLYTGIYVEGPNVGQCGQPYTCYNYWQEWEIPVHMEWFEPGGALGYGVDAGLQIYGAWSRMRPQKSVALYARPEYGFNAFEYPFFRDRSFDSYQNLVFRNSGNDWPNSMLRDGFMQALVKGTEIDRMAYQATVQFLNGEYWGILNAREKINEHYVANIGDVDPDSIDMLDFSSGPVAIHGDASHYTALTDYLQASSMTAPEDLAYVESMVDLDNWIDYQIAQIFFDNRDWPGNNTKIWRPRSADGRFRWILFDTDFGFGLYNSSAYTLNTLEFATESGNTEWPNPDWSTLFLRRMIRNGGFRTLFVNRFADFLNVHFAVDHMEAVLDSVAALIASEVPFHQARWGTLGGWNGEIDRLRTFAQHRGNYMLQHVQAMFGVASRSHLAVAVADPGGGTIRVNREHVGAEPWAGLYFVGIPVPVEAIPDEGYRFAGWTGSIESPDAEIDVDPSGGVSLFAHFVTDSLVDSPVVINEIQYHASDDIPSEDWVELVNTSLNEVDLSGWTLSDGDPANVFTVASGVSMEPGGYVVLCQDQVGFDAAYPIIPCQGEWTFGLSASGETIYLRDAFGTLVDSVAFDDSDPWPVAADGAGPTLELIDAALDNNLATVWQASFVRGGTPGRRNSTAVANEPPPELPFGSPRVAAFPNPFAGSATIVVEGPPSGDAVIEVFDALGRRISRLNLGHLAPGPNAIPWTEESSGPGLRFVRLLFDGMPVATTKVVRID